MKTQLALFTDKVELSGKVDLSGMDDDELDRELDQLAD